MQGAFFVPLFGRYKWHQNVSMPERIAAGDPALERLGGASS